MCCVLLLFSYFFIYLNDDDTEEEREECAGRKQEEKLLSSRTRQYIYARMGCLQSVWEIPSHGCFRCTLSLIKIPFLLFFARKKEEISHKDFIFKICRHFSARERENNKIVRRHFYLPATGKKCSRSCRLGISLCI